MLKKIRQIISGRSLLLEFIAPYRPMLLLAMVLMLLESLALLLNPWIAGQFIQSLSGEIVFANLNYQYILLLWFAVLAIQAILAFSNGYIVSITGEQMLARMRNKLFDHVQSLPLDYFHKRKRGDVLSLMANDIYYLNDFLTTSVLGLLPQLLTFFGALAFIYVIHAPFALLLGFSIPLFFIVFKILGRKIRPLSRDMVNEYSNLLAIIEENLQVLPVVKSFTRERYESDRFSNKNEQLLKLTDRYLKIQSLLSPLVYFLGASLILVLLWVSSELFLNEKLSIAAIVSLILYGMLIIRPVSSLADVYGKLQMTLGALERILSLFENEPEPVVNNPVVLKDVKGRVEFKNISFSYPEREAVIKDLSLFIEAGETVAITGKNGAGKSTLAYLLQRHADPQQGHILIDDIDIATLELSSLRQQIGVVHQNVLLLNDSIRENILYGRLDANNKLLQRVMNISGVTAFIDSLPNGYDTVIGDQGIKLSGGQKQRIALARALLKDPPILILDEATAMFDPESEKLMVEECFQTLKQKTVIIITHRPATLALADRVVEIKNGKIFELIRLVQSM